jgi:hypothetical protein
VQSQKHARSRFVLRAIVLGLLALFSIAPSLCATESTTAPDSSTLLAWHHRANMTPNSPATFTALTDVALTEELGVAFEDSDEMVRGDIRQQQMADVNYGRSTPGLSLKTDQSRRATFSPPLLV